MIDYANFVDRLGKILVETGTACFTWALIINHFQLILKTNQSNLSEFMKHFLVTYTVRFNRKHQGTGHVFQGRYNSLIVEEDASLLTLNRYIYLNPVRTLDLVPGVLFIGKKDPMAGLRMAAAYLFWK